MGLFTRKPLDRELLREAGKLVAERKEETSIYALRVSLRSYLVALRRDPHEVDRVLDYLFR